MIKSCDKMNVYRNRSDCFYNLINTLHIVKKKKLKTRVFKYFGVLLNLKKY